MILVKVWFWSFCFSEPGEFALEFHQRQSAFISG